MRLVATSRFTSLSSQAGPEEQTAIIKNTTVNVLFDCLVFYKLWVLFRYTADLPSTVWYPRNNCVSCMTHKDMVHTFLTCKNPVRSADRTGCITRTTCTHSQLQEAYAGKLFRAYPYTSSTRPDWTSDGRREARHVPASVCRGLLLPCSTWTLTSSSGQPVFATERLSRAVRCCNAEFEFLTSVIRYNSTAERLRVELCTDHVGAMYMVHFCTLDRVFTSDLLSVYGRNEVKFLMNHCTPIQHTSLVL